MANDVFQLGSLIELKSVIFMKIFPTWTWFEAENLFLSTKISRAVPPPVTGPAPKLFGSWAGGQAAKLYGN